MKFIFEDVIFDGLFGAQSAWKAGRVQVFSCWLEWRLLY
jgi:hypothetical protein